MKLKKPIIGGVVQSLQGRDKGCYYIVIKIEGNFAYVCDGKAKRLDCLKRKNVKHLYLLPVTEQSLAQRFASNAKVYDYEIVTALKKYRKP